MSRAPPEPCCIFWFPFGSLLLPLGVCLFHLVPFLAAQPVHSSLVAPLAAVLPQRKHAGPGHQVTIKSLESRSRLKSSHWEATCTPFGCKGV